MQKITPFLWYDNNLEEAINLYSSIFKNMKVHSLKKYPGGPMEGKVMMAEFEIEGQRIAAMDAGPTFKFNESFSLMVMCDDQAEVDKYWNELTANGGEESQCGWLKDKFGLSWQITPKRMMELFADSDPARANRAMQAMLGMKKLVIADLEKAAEGN